MKVLADVRAPFAIRGLALRIALSLLALLALLALPWITDARAAQTVVTFTFDDGIKTQADLARPALAARGMHGTFYINSGNVGANSYYMTWSQVAAVAADGNEIGGHTLNHKKLTNLTAAEQRRQICDDRVALQARGYTVTNFAYPNGAGGGNATTRSIVKDCGYTTARKVGGIRDASDCSNCPYAETIQPADALAVRSNPYVTGAMTLAKLQGWITQTEQHGGGWVVLMFHDICNGCYDASVSESDFGALLDWLKPREANGTVVKTVREALDVSLPPPPPPDTTPPSTSISCNGASCPATPLSPPVSISLSATDSGSGVAATRYTTDGSDPTTSSTAYAGPFSVSQTTTVKYRSWDVAGNAEQVRSQTVNVSTPGSGPAAAITSPAAGATVSGTVNVIVNTTGIGSSPDVDLYVDGQFKAWRTNNVNPYQIPWNTGSATVGSHSIRAWVTDSFGVITKSAAVTVNVKR